MSEGDKVVFILVYAAAFLGTVFAGVWVGGMLSQL